jgi:tetratricopeptide (TPR) repeat protein
MIHNKGARALIVFLLLFICSTAQAEQQSVFHLTPGCLEAQKHIAALRLQKAKAILAVEKKSLPHNAAVAFLENTLDYYQIVTSQDFSLLKPAENARNKRVEALKRIPASSPFLLYTQSEMHLQWAFLKIFHEHYIGAMLDFRTAYNLAVENQKKFPAFKAGNKTIGLFKALVGSTPDNYKWVLSAVGLKGNFDEGMTMIEQYVHSNPSDEFILDEQMAVFYYGLFQMNFGDKQKAWEFVKKHTNDYKSNLISSYLRAYVGMKSGHNEDAINTLAERPKSTDYEPFYVLDYLYGQAKLNRLDEDAEQPLKRFVSFYKGKFLMKDAYRRISWHYLLRGEKDKYEVYKALSQRYGSSNSEEDKYIQKEAQLGRTPEVILIKARLLFDGGYYNKAEETIKQINPEKTTDIYVKLEYHYRYARILHEQNKLHKAIDYYSYVVKYSPVNTPYYFAPNSCLQMGYIYQKLGFNQIAKSHFNNVSLYSKAEYVDGLKLKAKIELEKIDG